ncbi:LCP family protein [Anaerofustis sp.]|uniref:LCP family protein n=1 Tax=Anaerofustis sp. TaxID=1872517 RepID=UPI0025BFE17E|nr:LCP family protein [Anaerofustis sp.]
MGKIIVKRADGEIIKIDENEALGELRKIRNKEQNNRKRNVRKKRPTNNSNQKRRPDPPQRRRPNRDYIDREQIADNSRKRKKRRKQKKPLIKKLKKIAVFVLVALIIVSAFGYYQVNQIFAKMNTVEFPTSDSELGISPYVNDYYRKENKYIKNYALFGVDSRGEESGRTDSLMICSVNTKTGEISLTSVLRDSYIKIAQVDDKDYGFDKINAAHSFGGPIMTVKTLNENFDLNIHDYVEVNFKAVADIVDALGGITVDVKEDEIENLNKYIRENNRLLKGKASKELTKSGKQTLDGKQALSYCRIRYAGNGDYQRTARQRIVMGKIYNKLKKSSLLTQKKALESVLPHITTSLKSKDMWPIIFAYLKSESGPKSQSLTNEDIVKSGTINGGWCLIFDDLKSNVQYLHKLIYKNEYTVSPTVEERNNAYAEKTMYTTKYAIDSKVYTK